MQIHELTQPGKPQVDEVFDTTRAFLKNPKSLLSRRGRINAQATGAAAKLAKQGYTGEAPTLDQSLERFKQNPAAQQWVNSIVAKWPAQAQKMPKSAAPVTEDEPVYLPGSKKPLDPNNPKDAEVLAAMSKQGLTPPITTKSVSGIPKKRRQGTTAPVTPGAPTYADAFRQWVNQELKTISLDNIEKSVTELAPRLEKIIDEIVKNQNNLPAQQKLVHDFFSLAVAANHVVQKQSGSSMGAGYGPAVANNADVAIPLDAASELKLMQGLRGVRRLRSTRNPAVDGMFQKLGITIIP